MTARSLLYFYYLLLLALVPAHLYINDCAFDDAYIHFRIARNFLLHNQPYFNLGDKVMATSSTVWLMLLSAAWWCSEINLLIVALLNALITAFGALVWGILSNRQGMRIEASLCLMILYVCVLFHASIGMMETPLALLLLGLAILRYQEGKATAFMYLSIACFTRLEMSVFLFAALVHGMLKRDRAVLRSIFVSALSGAPFLIFQMVYFGAAIPQTVRAKSIVYDASPAINIRLVLNQIFGESLLASSRGAIGIYLLSLTVSLLIWTLTSRFQADKLRSMFADSAFWILGGFAIFLVYLLRHALIFPWYIPLFLWPAVYALFSATTAVEGQRSTLLRALIGIPFLVRFGLNLASMHPDYRYLFQDYDSSRRVQTYLEVGARIGSEYPRKTILSSEIGALGWASSSPMIDACGLASPEALKFHPLDVPAERGSAIVGAIPKDLVRSARPEIIVTMEMFFPRFEASEAAQDYVREQTIQPQVANAGSSIWGQPVEVWVRRDAARLGT